jgi:hypothetical protein
MKTQFNAANLKLGIHDIKQIINLTAIKCFYFCGAFVALAEFLVLAKQGTVIFSEMPAFWVTIISAPVFAITADDWKKQSGFNTIASLFNRKTAGEFK